MGALEDSELCLFRARDLCTGTPQVTLREVAALSTGLSQRRLAQVRLSLRNSARSRASGPLRPAKIRPQW